MSRPPHRLTKITTAIIVATIAVMLIAAVIAKFSQ
jgi:hypothetical protein